MIEPMYGGKTAARDCGAADRRARSPRRTTSSRITGLAQWPAAIKEADLAEGAERRRGRRREAGRSGEGHASTRRSWRRRWRRNRKRRRTGIEVGFVPSSATWDGRFANNGWMQEAPDPITKLTWGNAALISPGDGARAEA